MAVEIRRESEKKRINCLIDMNFLDTTEKKDIRILRNMITLIAHGPET